MQYIKSAERGVDILTEGLLCTKKGKLYIGIVSSYQKGE